MAMTQIAPTPAGNHRKRTGVERRERTRALLIRSAIAFVPLPGIGPTSPCVFATPESAR